MAARAPRSLSPRTGSRAGARVFLPRGGHPSSAHHLLRMAPRHSQTMVRWHRVGLGSSEVTVSQGVESSCSAAHVAPCTPAAGGHVRGQGEGGLTWTSRTKTLSSLHYLRDDAVNLRQKNPIKQ